MSAETVTKSMTVSEAITAGYKFCGRSHEDWQTLEDINDVEFEDEEWFLFEKEPISPGIDAKDLKDLISEHIECNWSDQTGDDTERVFHALKSIDYEPMAKLISDAVAGIYAYYITKIRLMPDSQ